MSCSSMDAPCFVRASHLLVSLVLNKKKKKKKIRFFLLLFSFFSYCMGETSNMGVGEGWFEELT